MTLASLAFPPAAGRALAQDNAKAKGAFTDFTADSGIGKIIADNYAKSPKWWLSGLYLIDLDGDGRLDFVTGAHGVGPAIAALNDGKGHFTLAEGFKGTEVHICADLNNDGKVDIQMNDGDGGGRWWINESTPGKVSMRDSGVTAAHGHQARANALIDLDRDGNVDWLHARPGVVWQNGDGSGGFPRGGAVDAGGVKNETNIHYGDLQGKGFIDLALHWGRYENEKGRSCLLFSDDKGVFTNATKAAGLSDQDGLAIKGIGDVNQDGWPDLIVLENKKPEIYLNDGKGHFTKLEGAFEGWQASAHKPAYASWGLAVVTDFDNDGVADIIWNGRNFLWVFRGMGGGKFKYMNKEWGITDFSAATVDDGLCFGDIDGDGALDIIGYGTGGSGEQREVKVYRNNLPKLNWLRVRPVGLTGNINAAGAKIRIFEAGKSGTAAAGEKPLWCEQVQIISSQSAQSYYSYAQTERHFGLGDWDKADVSVEFYPSGKKVEKKNVSANRIVTVFEATGRVEEKELK
jgi:hypothetical protein